MQTLKIKSLPPPLPAGPGPDRGRGGQALHKVRIPILSNDLQKGTIRRRVKCCVILSHYA